MKIGLIIVGFIVGVLASAKPLGGGGAVLALLDLTPVRRLENVRSCLSQPHIRV